MPTLTARQLATLFAVAMLCGVTAIGQAEAPTASYLFPAGGQRGTTVSVRIGGHFLHDKADFLLDGTGIDATSAIERTKTVWFEGPLILQPASQQKEDYPKDYSAQVKLAADAPLGLRLGHCTTSQGITPALRFVVGDLPEIIEHESEDSGPTSVALPVTINGRIFPREDVDEWVFEAKAGQVITCEVNAARLGSGLDSRLEVLDPHGRLLAENSDAFGSDSFVRLPVKTDGRHTVRIHDVRFEGLQHFVYRLTISAGPWLDRVYPLGGRKGTTVSLELFGANLPAQRIELPITAEATDVSLAEPTHTPRGSAAFVTDDLPEHLEAEPNDETTTAKLVELPSVLNGRIDRPGDVDLWTFAGKKGDTWQFDLRASRLGSELDGVLTLLNDKGQALATADDLGNGQTDAVLTTTLPTDGTFVVKVEDRISSRGGSAFPYRLRGTRAADAALKLTTLVDAVTVLQGGETRVKVLAERPHGYGDEIPLELTGLPEGVTVSTPKFGKGQTQIDLVLKADAAAKVTTSRFRIAAKYKIGEAERVAVAVVQRPLGEPPTDELLLRVGVPTPFKLKGEFESKYAPRGSVFTRKYRVERNGFSGPLWVELADRQARHLQGVTGPRLSLAAEQSEFEYPFSLPPRMEIGRTSRTCLAVFGEVIAADGTKHVVSHSSQEQNDQAIVIVEPNRLSLETTVQTVRRVPGDAVRVPVKVSRGVGLSGIVRVEAVTPLSASGVQVDTIELPGNSSTGEVTLRFDSTGNSTDSTTAPSAKASVSATLKLRASMTDERGLPVTDEVSLKIVTAP